MRDHGREDEKLEEQGAERGPRKNHGDVNEELVPGVQRSPIREEREKAPSEEDRRPG